MLSVVALSAQDAIVVRGNVSDMSGQPLIWVMVEVKKMYSSDKIDIKTDTDIDGNHLKKKMKREGKSQHYLPTFESHLTQRLQ